MNDSPLLDNAPDGIDYTSYCISIWTSCTYYTTSYHLIHDIYVGSQCIWKAINTYVHPKAGRLVSIGVRPSRQIGSVHRQTKTCLHGFWVNSIGQKCCPRHPVLVLNWQVVPLVPMTLIWKRWCKLQNIVSLLEISHWYLPSHKVLLILPNLHPSLDLLTMVKMVV